MCVIDGRESKNNNNYANDIYSFGLRFMFYSDDHEPVHVHIKGGGREAKYNVQPVEMVYNHGFKKHELSLIEAVIEENVEVITERWQEFFKQK